METVLSIFAFVISVLAIAISGTNKMRVVRIEFARRCSEIRSSLANSRLSLITLREEVRARNDGLDDTVEAITKHIARLKKLDDSVYQLSDQASLIWWLPKFTSLETKLEMTAGNCESLGSASRVARIYLESNNLQAFREVLGNDSSAKEA